MHHQLKLTCGLSLAALLAACGGGSGAVQPPSTALTADQIRQYSAHSVFAGLELPVPSTLLTMAVLSYAQDPDEGSLECDSGTATGEYIDVDESGTVSAGDKVNFTFNQCEASGDSEFSPTGDAMDFKFDGKLHAVITEYDLPMLARAAATPAHFMANVSKASKAAPISAHVGVKLQYEQLQIMEDEKLDGTMRTRLSITVPDLDVLARQAAPDDSPSIVIAHSQESGEELKVSYSEAGKNYALTISEFRSEDNLSCNPDASCDDDSDDDSDDDAVQHRFTTLQFTNKGSDYALGSSFEYRMRLAEPLVPFSSGTVLTETSGETITTTFSTVNQQPMVAIKSTGGAAWSGDLDKYTDD
ncbi:hypothetical protein PIGHUM_02289 [Pigmentiphaga humi]|uniref:Lipoprotein n=1 Tax=Pigmentiphaga humi TaxID=2478468 RepID=A0A3P4B2D5_9BURK|nr:hypothetical protein [Pigmentiphaga humi]VCU70222.1 hypothetical protein PIGHUM_02289 [Pigmentiphaga humi]